jgi:hypothetical protein
VDVFYDLELGESADLGFFGRPEPRYVGVEGGSGGFFNILEIKMLPQSECLTNIALDYNFFTHDSACWVIRTNTKAIWFPFEE